MAGPDKQQWLVMINSSMVARNHLKLLLIWKLVSKAAEMANGGGLYHASHLSVAFILDNQSSSLQALQQVDTSQFAAPKGF